MSSVFLWPAVCQNVRVNDHLVSVPTAEGVAPDIKMEVVSNSVEISTSDSVPTIGSLVSFEEGVKVEAGTSATTASSTGTTTTSTSTGTVYSNHVENI